MSKTAAEQQPKRFLRIAAVVNKTGMPPSSVYAKMADGTFPKSISLGPRCKAWLEEEIDQWMDDRVSQRGAA